MSERNVLAELRSWRDEFARSHGYDLRAMVAALGELDKAVKGKVVRGEPRRPETRPAPVNAPNKSPQQTGQANNASS